MIGLEIVPTIISMLVVLAALGLTLFALRWATQSRQGSAKRTRRSTPMIDVVERQSIGRNGSLIVVRYAGSEHLLGVTETTITTLAEGTIDLRDLDPADQGSEEQKTPGPIETLRRKTVRR